MFLFELSLALGIPHPRYLLEHLNSEDLVDWQAFYSLRPFGFVRESMLHGVPAALFFNANKASGRNRKWSDFFPVTAEVKDSGRDSNEKIMALFAEYNRERGYK